jgi:hypothetical protein
MIYDMISPPSKAKSPRKKKLLWAVAIVAAVGAGVGATIALWPKPDPQKVLAEIGNDPVKIREAVQSGRVSPEDLRARFEAQMNQRMDAYFALQTPGERNRYLDGIIDEMEARRKQWEAERANRPQGERDGRGDPRRGDGPATRPSDAEIQRRQLERQNSVSAARQAQGIEFRRALMRRMQERGIQGGGRGFGPGMGGPGGGRGGERRG